VPLSKLRRLLIMALGRHLVAEDPPNLDDFLANAVIVS
jgi:hypothetical protein